MNRDMLKTFILGVLVALSFLLSYILWSYQPKYEMFYDADYISETDIGGKERTKNDLILPKQIVFHNRQALPQEELLGFKKSSDENLFYKEISTWSLTDINLQETRSKDIEPQEDHYVEIAFPSTQSGQLLENIFTFNENVDFPTWSFERIFIVVNDENELTVRVYSINHSQQWEATVEKAGAYQAIGEYNVEHPHLQSYVNVSFGAKPIYIPETVTEVTKKTLVANELNPELFVNALFSNPSLVRPNQQKSFFTDGQRGMRIFQEGRYLEFIHPIETSDDKLDPIALMDRSIAHINEHKGWINEYHLESANANNGTIKYRLHYDGMPVFDFNNLSLMEQIWRDEDLHQYRRSLLQIGHLLNVSDVDLPDSNLVIRTLLNNDDYELDKIYDIRLGFDLNYITEVHSLTLEPCWFIQYEHNWIRLSFTENDTDYASIRGD